MVELIVALSALIADHWSKFVVAGVVSITGWLFAGWKAKKEWKNREFFHRINFSLNTVRDATLLIRTLSEKPCSEVFLNETAVRELVKAAQTTTPNDPVIPLVKDDCWYYLNAVLNELSEQFATGLLEREAGKPVVSVPYLICLTNECDGDMRTRKVRALVTRRDLLENFPKDTPKFESPHHRIRWTTLKHLSARLKKEPWRFLEVELVV